ncbi:MAG: glycosyltransferase [Candidatus Saccharimonadales bacterium]
MLQRIRVHRFNSVNVADSEMPTVSVCIPARNEERALGSCLERVLASEYEKLEVIVLDDSSSDDTSLIIKTFAHAGVRFIAGKPLADDWTGKNHALDTMAREANGSIIIFMDIDTLIAPTTISQVVRQMQTNKLDGMWVLPLRADLPRWSALIGHMRYFWEIVTSSSRRPISSGSFWGIRRGLLIDTLGGFDPVREYIQPEYPIAQWVQARHAYEGVIGTRELGVYYEKRWHSQYETGERTLYLMVRRGVAVGLLMLGTLFAWVGSLILIIYCLVSYDTSWLNTITLSAVIIMVMTWYIYLRKMWKGFALLGVFVLPYIVVQELWLLCLSWVRYKFGRVTWKGRHINAPKSNRSYIAIDQ